MKFNWTFWQRTNAAEAAALPKLEGKRAMKINPTAAANAMAPGEPTAGKPFVIPSAAPGVIPDGAKLAMDEATSDAYVYAMGDAYAEGLVFMGYPALSQLAQRSEYRRPAEILAQEMTRKWIKVTSTGTKKEEGGEDKFEKIKAIEAELVRIGARAAFKLALEHDGFFGRAQIYIDVGDVDDDELKTPLSQSKDKIVHGALKGLNVIEPMWTYPGSYNSTNPLKADFFKPSTWYVMGKEVHGSRLMTIVSREVPDMLKPAYAFGGLSLSQMCKPYVDNWLQTRQGVSDIIQAFTVWVLKTNMSSILGGDPGDDVFARLDIFNRTRSNRGVMAVDKDTEEFANVSTSLAGLDHLQAQAQEHMSAAAGIPLVKLFGISPSGLNASSEGEITTFYDGIEAGQESVIRPELQRLFNIVQLSLFGDIDPEIGFEFEPLETMDPAQRSTIRKTEADTAGVWIDKGVIDPIEARKVLATQEDSPYASLDLSHVPDPPAQPGEEGEEGGPSDPADPTDPLPPAEPNPQQQDRPA